MQRIIVHFSSARPRLVHRRLVRPLTTFRGADVLNYNDHTTRNSYLHRFNSDTDRFHFNTFSTTACTRKKQNPGGEKYHHGSGSSSPSPLEAFFAKYAPKFQYDATVSAPKEFCRLCKESGWDKDHPERWKAHQKFKDALVQQFNLIYGKNVNDLASWQSLCHVVRIDPIPNDLRACRKAVYFTFVNLVDLVETHATRKEVCTFESEKALSEYTCNTEKFFPRKNVHAGSLLKYLLRRIHRPHDGYNVRLTADTQRRKRTQADCCVTSSDPSAADGTRCRAKR